MSRTLPSTVSSAITSATTKPIYLIQFGFSPAKYAATWDSDITWNGQTWSAGGVDVSRLTMQGATLSLPTGADDTWLSTIMAQGVRRKTINIYEHHTDTTASPQTDAVLVFSGVMDAVRIGNRIQITVLESSQSKVFPPSSVDESVFTYLLSSGQKISWGSDTITVT